MKVIILSACRVSIIGLQGEHALVPVSQLTLRAWHGWSKLEDRGVGVVWVTISL